MNPFNQTTMMRIRKLRLKQAATARSLKTSDPAHSRIENLFLHFNINSSHQPTASFSASAKSMMCNAKILELLVLENEALKQCLAESQSYTAKLNENQFPISEMLRELKIKCKENGGYLKLVG